MVHAIAKRCGAKTVVDVGSGQVCHMHASIYAIVTRFQVDIIVFLILGQLASLLVPFGCDYAFLNVTFMYSSPILSRNVPIDPAKYTGPQGKAICCVLCMSICLYCMILWKSRAKKPNYGLFHSFSNSHNLQRTWPIWACLLFC